MNQIYNLFCKKVSDFLNNLESFSNEKYFDPSFTMNITQKNFNIKKLEN